MNYMRFLLYCLIGIVAYGLFISQINISVVLGLFTQYDFRFLSASLALLGLGFGGIAVSLMMSKIHQKRSRMLGTLGILYACSIVLLAFFSLGIPGRECMIHEGVIGLLISALIHFFLGGCLISALLVEGKKQLYGMMFSDYLGCALGALVLLVATDRFGLFASLYLSVGSGIWVLVFLWLYIKRRTGWVVIVLVLGIAAALAALMVKYPLSLSCGKEGSIVEKSNSFSYLRIYERDQTEQYSGYEISINNGSIFTNGFVASSLDSLKERFTDLRSLPFMATDGTRACIIGSGLGNDMYRGALAGWDSMTAVEINPLLVDFINSAAGQQRVSPYRLPGVKTEITEARSFLTGTDEKYDLVLIAHSKSFGRPFGAQLFLPKNLYTKEAFSEYLRHLTPNGTLVIVDYVWYTRQYISTLRSLLTQQGIDHKDHLISYTKFDDRLYREGTEYIFLKPGGFTSAQQAQLKELSDRFLMEPTRDTSGNARYHSDIVLTDDKPFIWQPETGRNNYWFPQEGILKDFFLVVVISVIIIVISVILFLIRMKVSSETLAIPVFFGGISTGLAALEFVLVSKMTLLIGNPVYAHVIILSSILISGGFGSLFAQLPRVKKHLGSLAFISAALIIGAYLFLDQAIAALLPRPELVRAAVAVLLVSIPSFIAGTLFPIALERTSKQREEMLPWVWGIDSMIFVCASLIISYSVIFMGIRSMLIIGAVGYLVAGVSAWFIRR